MDFLPPGRRAARASGRTYDRRVTDAALVAFLQWALPRLRYRWPGFRKVRRQVRKRLARRLEELRLPDLGAYRAYLDAHEEEWAALDDRLRITISRFYRDRATWDALRASVLPALAERALARDGVLRAWSLGCASGEEPYTLALVWHHELAQRFSGLRLFVRATDLDPHLLRRAQAGVYTGGSFRELPRTWRRASFELLTDGVQRLRDEVRALVAFERADARVALRAPAGRPVDLLLCRYLIYTYFAPDLQAELTAAACRHLAPGGALVVGSHEAPPGETLEPWPDAPRVWRVQGPRELSPSAAGAAAK